MKLEKVKKQTLWDVDSGNEVVTIEDSLEEDFDYFFRVDSDQYTRKDLTQVANFILEVVKREDLTQVANYILEVVKDES